MSDLNPEIESLRKKLKIRKDYLIKFLSKLSTDLTLEEVKSKIEEKYGRDESKRSEENEGGNEENVNSGDIQQEAEQSIEGDATEEQNSDVEVSERGSTETESTVSNDKVQYSESLRVESVVVDSKKYYDPITGEPV